MTSRRGFLIGIGAALAAPAIVKAESLMKIATVRQSLSERTVTELFMRLERLEAQLGWNPSHLVCGAAWQAIVDREGNIKIIEYPAESVYAQSS